MNPHRPEFQRVVYCRGALCFLLICAITSITSACITTMSLQEATGESAKLKVRLLKVNSGLPVIFLEETPQHNETILAVGPITDGCQRYSTYVNPTPQSPHPLTTEPLEIDPLLLDHESDELDLWNLVPDEHCALVLMIGAVEDTGFAGLSLSTREGPVKRVGMYFQDDKSGKGAFWFYTLYPAPIADAVLVVVGGPVFGVMAIDSAIDDPFTDPVTVSFDFPDGTRRQASLTYPKAEDMLRRNFPHLFSPLLKEWNDIRFWTRAALLELRLDFREVVSADNGDITLGQVGSYQGRWRHDPRDGRGLQDDIRASMQDTRYIRYQCSSCAVVPLVGVVKEPPPVPQPEVENNKLQLLRESAETGNPESQWHLYADEGARVQDWPWLCKAADQKHGEALAEIGNILWEGRDGITRDRELAYCWYKAALAAGYEPAASDILAAEWMLSDTKIETAMMRCADGKMLRCEELLLPAVTHTR